MEYILLIIRVDRVCSSMLDNVIRVIFAYFLCLVEKYSIRRGFPFYEFCKSCLFPIEYIIIEKSSIDTGDTSIRNSFEHREEIARFFNHSSWPYLCCFELSIAEIYGNIRSNRILGKYPFIRYRISCSYVDDKSCL